MKSNARAADQAALDAEAKAFSGKGNETRRAIAWNAIPHFGKMLNAQLNLVEEARKLLGPRRTMRALTLACGDMTGEYFFLKAIGATSILAYDISEGQRQRFFDKVYDGSIEVDYRIGDVNALELPADSFDAVYMQQSLHHIVEVERVLAAIHAGLVADGAFFLNDYVGEPFLQRGPKQREVCQKLWSCLPPRLRTNKDGEVLDQIHIPAKAILSPFEAVRSDAILPALTATFKPHKQVLYAGLLFPLVNNFAQNYDGSRELDATLVKLLWELDRIMVADGTVEASFVRGIYLKR